MNLGIDALGSGKFVAGTAVQVSYSRPDGDGTDIIDAEGTIQRTGMLGGMARHFKNLSLQLGDRLKLVCQVSETGGQSATVLQIIRRDGPVALPSEIKEQPIDRERAVLENFNAQHVPFDMYRPELWDEWKPAAEVDVYLAFGRLQEYTDYLYSCGVNKQILRQLGIDQNYEEEGVPDALFC